MQHTLILLYNRVILSGIKFDILATSFSQNVAFDNNVCLNYMLQKVVFTRWKMYVLHISGG